MSAIDEFSSLVATLYEATSDPQQWHRFVVQFYEAMGATRGVLTAQAADPARTRVFLEGYTDSERRVYAEYYHQHDQVLTAGLRVIENRSEWIGPLEEIYPFKTLESSEIYNDYYRDLDMHFASCVMVGPTGPYSSLGMAAWRSKTSGPFTPDQHQLAGLLTPHLKQAFRLQAKLSAAGSERTAFHTALEAAAVTVVALGADGHILAASPSAEALLSRAAVVVRRGGKLNAVDPKRNSTLQLLINRAARAGGVDLIELGGQSVQPGGAMLLPQAGGQLALQVQVLPVRAQSAIWIANPAVLVFIGDPGATPPGRSHILKDLYQLTPTEARLTDLFLQGLELKQASDELKLTYENTRFHLKQIFRKTNTTRQTQLLRLLLAIPA